MSVVYKQKFNRALKKAKINKDFKNFIRLFTL